MNGNCHFLYSASIISALCLNLDKIEKAFEGTAFEQTFSATPLPVTVTLLLMGGIVGGLFPDIDNPKSHIGQIAQPLSTIISKIGRKFYKTGGSWHRGMMHDPSIYLVGLYVSFLYFPPLIGFFIGCMSHVILDMFNPAGVPYAFGYRRLHLGNFRSGSTMSILFSWSLSIFNACIGIGYFLLW